jgi:putative ABC transport system permease protein
VLDALGCSSWTRSATIAATRALAVVAGVAVAVAASWATSTLVPSALGRKLDPELGAWVDGWRVAALALVLLAGALGVLAFGSRRLARARVTARAGASPRAVAVLAGSSVPRWLGVRAVLGGTDRGATRSTRLALATTVVAVAGVLAVPVWRASLDHLLHTPRLTGWDFDAAVRVDGSPDLEAPAAADALAERLAASVPLIAIERVDVQTMTLATKQLELLGIRSVRGSVHPTMRSGRPPVNADEVVLAGPIMAALHTSVGKVVELPGAAELREFVVVGEAVYPELGNGSFGFYGSVTDAGFRDLGLEPNYAYLLVRQGTPETDLSTLVGDGSQVMAPTAPIAVGFLTEVGSADDLLAWFLAAFASATLVHLLVVAARARRRDDATLRALGLTRGQLAAGAGWQGALVAVVSLVAAIPIGIVLGRLAWRTVTRDLPALDAFVVPGGWAAVVASATALVTIGCSVLVGAASVRSTPPSVLRQE